MRFALVDPNNVIVRVLSDQQIDPTVSTRPGWRWLPVVTNEVQIDPATQVREGPNITVEPTQVVEQYTARNKTAQELDQDKEVQVPEETNILFKIAFNHENRVRVLEGKAPITALQFRAALKALL